MSELSDLILDIFALSGCFWLLICIYSIFSIKRFIVKRYENETKLTDTIFFQEHFTFYKYQPDFLSSGLYASHLLMCAWAWRFYGKRKIFRDIENPQVVTQYFTSSEIRRVKRAMMIVGIVIIHIITYYILKFIWPELF